MDRFYRGFVSGILAAIPLNAWSLFSYYVLNLTDRRMLDWGAVLIFGSAPQVTAHFVFGLLMQLVWSGFRGILFAYLLLLVGREGLIGKFVIFSVIATFMEEVAATALKIPHLAETTTGTVLSTLIGATLWGVLLYYIYTWLERRVSA